MNFKLNRIDYLNILILFILSFIFCSELFFSKYQPQTFDQPTHVTTITQFSEIIKKGEIPVIWVDKFANYGYPLGLFAQQTTAYFGAFINIIFDNHIFSYNLLVLFGSSLLSISTYLFLRMYFNRKICLVSSSLINFSAYKIINIYIRGAFPEFLSTPFFILALLGIHLFFKKKKSYAFFLLTISLVMILLTHPMMFVIYAPFICLYFLLINKNNNLGFKKFTILISSFILAFVLSAYYLIPLKLENKYFVMGNSTSSINSDQFLKLSNYFSPDWYYFLTHPGPRGNFIKFGLIETILLLSSIPLLGYISRSNINKKKFFYFSLLSSIILIFLTTSLSLSVYKLPFIREIQYPWRALNVLMIFPPIFLAFILDKFKNNTLYLSVFLLIMISRMPQIYTKNVINFSNQRYEFTKYNLHINDLTLNWIGEPSSYLIRDQKVAIVEGRGIISDLNIENSSRTFNITANENLRLVDYTFYFPGWNVYIDGIKTSIEYQDPSYRGIITYQVPAGNHQIQVIFQETNIRKYSKYISFFGLAILFALLFYRKKLFHKLV